MSKFYIIPHTHWDREWHKTFEEYRVRCIEFFDNVLDVLENTDFPCFVLDGQTSVVLDYLDVKPFNKDRIIRLVQSGKLKIGPWFVQPDEYIPSLESLIKNLLVSANIAKDFGKQCNVGYLPDSFGQSSVMPTILNGFGIKDAVFYRGFTEDHAKTNQFRWKGVDNSTVNAYWLKTGYGNGMFLSAQLENDIKQIQDNIALSNGRQAFDKYLVLAGSDQCFLKEHLTTSAKNLTSHYSETGENHEFVVCDFDEFFKQVREDYANLDEVSAEFRYGKHSRVHISIGATRQDIKKKNFQVEKLYEKQLEPTCVIATKLGSVYPKEMIERGERYYLENHAHDSMCCVCTDFVHKEIEMRMDKASQIAKSLLEKGKKDIYSKIKFKNLGRPVVLISSDGVSGLQQQKVTVSTKKPSFELVDGYGKKIKSQIINQEKYNLKDTIVAFSPVPDDWYFLSTVLVFKEFKSVGYETVYIVENDGDALKVNSTTTNNIENEFYKITVLENGTIDVFSKEKNTLYNNFIKIVDMGNAGDEYDYSPPHQDKLFYSEGNLTSLKVLDNNLCKTLKAKYKMQIPTTTENLVRSEDLNELESELVISLSEGIDLINVSLKILNRSLNHRVCVQLDSKSKHDKHLASIQNATVERASYNCEFYDKSIKEKWSEVYYPIYPLNGFVHFKDEFTLCSSGQVQYQTFENGNQTALYLTALSSVSYMGNENLKYRPGRRSGAVCKTEDSKMIGEYTADFALSFNGDYEKTSRAYYSKTVAINYPICGSKGVFADSNDFIRTTLEVSSFKMAEDKDGYIARFICKSILPVQNEKIFINPIFFSEAVVVGLDEKLMQNNNVEIMYDCNADMSERKTFSGEVVIKEMKNGEIVTLRVK